jgi:hypothetical protein
MEAIDIGKHCLTSVAAASDAWDAGMVNVCVLNH